MPTSARCQERPNAPESASASAVASPAGIPSADWGEGASCQRFVHSDLAADARSEAVEAFLRSHACPVEGLAPEFVLAAELNSLDYRLLPVLAVLETGCGRRAKNQNLFGWANGRKPFATFAQSIHFVAQRLRLAPHYAGKPVSEKLRVYNRRSWYRRKVLAMMESMPAEPGRMADAGDPSPRAGGL